MNARTRDYLTLVLTITAFGLSIYGWVDSISKFEYVGVGTLLFLGALFSWSRPTTFILKIVFVLMFFTLFYYTTPA